MNDKVLITGADGFVGKHIHGGKPYIGRITHAGLSKQVNDCVGILHLAAKSNKRICEDDTAGCLQSNLYGLCDVLEIALQKKLWVVHASTFAVSDTSLYGLSKLIGEEICHIYQRKGVEVHIIRLPIIYGPHDQADKVVTKFISQLKRGIEPSIGNGAKFPFAYVEDIAVMFESICDRLAGGYGKPFTLRELRDAIKECL